MQTTLRHLILLAVTLASMAAQASAQVTWPTRTVKIVVPVGAGTATDLTARVFGERLAAKWGQSVVVENRPGADGLIAIGSFVHARDDHTLLFSFSTAVSLNPMVHAKLPYDAAVDIVPITTTSEVLFVLATNSAVPVTTVKEAMAYARANPGKLNWAASPGLPRFVLDRYFKDQKLDLAYVSYNQPNGAVQDLGEGRIQMMIVTLNTVLPAIESGKARLLAVTARDRAVLTPNVPSVIEAGYPELLVPGLGCVFGWKDIPASLVDRLAREIDEAAQDRDLVGKLDKLGQTVRRSTPADLAKILVEQRETLTPIAAAIAATHK